MCRQLCYLMSYTLHTLMLSNTVHTGFGQRLCRMDNPEMIIEMWVCLKEKLPCSMLERKAIAMLNQNVSPWLWGYSNEQKQFCGPLLHALSWTTLMVLQTRSSTHILICLKVTYASLCPHSYVSKDLYHWVLCTWGEKEVKSLHYSQHHFHTSSTITCRRRCGCPS